jgi:CBS domain-containing protein
MKNTIAERIYDFLKNFPPFDVLEKEQLLKIASQVKVTYLEKDTFIFRQAENPGENFYVVKDGAIGLTRIMDGEEILVDICDEGDIFGLRSPIQNNHYLLNAKSKEESILYAISVDILKEIIETNDSAHKFLIASYSTNIRAPYANGSNAQLFANEDVLLSNKSNLSDIQTAKYSKHPVTCLPTTTIQEAAQIMCTKRVGSILIVKNKKPVGIITDKDLRIKIATGLISIGKNVTEIMSSPVITAPEKITVAEAQISMIKNKITHLCITKDGTPNSELIGLLSEHDIVVLHGNNPSVLVKELKRAKDVNTLKYIRDKTSDLLNGYIEQNIPIIFVSKIISEINDAIIIKAIEFSLNEMENQPPVKFGWLTLGSQGRKEQLLITDQDNALIFEDVPTKDYKKTKNYFLKLAKSVTDKLHIIGYDYCPADMMASNPKWCLSSTEWKNQFNAWITQPTEKAIMMCTIFFDYTLLYGDTNLVSNMTESIFKSIDSFDIFLNFLAKNALLSKPPLSFFRQFVVEHDGENKDQFDLKSRALMPLTDAARVLTLAHNIKDVNNTILRFQDLAEAEPNNKELYLSCIDSFKILLRYRTKQGIKHNDSGRYVGLNNLSKAEKLKLKGCFKPIKDIQDLLSVRYNLAQLS